MSLKFGVLGLLHDHAMTGYDIYHYFDSVLSPMWFAQQSQVYRELGSLEKEGLVSSHIEPQVGKPDKRIYKITDAGIEAMTQWVKTYDFTESMRYRDGFALRIFFTGRIPHLLCNLIEQLACYIDENSKQLAHLTLQESELNEALKLAQVQGNFLEEERLFYFKLSLMRGKSLFEMNCNWANEALLMCKKREVLNRGNLD